MFVEVLLARSFNLACLSAALAAAAQLRPLAALWADTGWHSRGSTACGRSHRLCDTTKTRRVGNVSGSLTEPMRGCHQVACLAFFRRALELATWVGGRLVASCRLPARRLHFDCQRFASRLMHPGVRMLGPRRDQPPPAAGIVPPGTPSLAFPSRPTRRARGKWREEGCVRSAMPRGDGSSRSSCLRWAWPTFAAFEAGCKWSRANGVTGVKDLRRGG